MVQVATKLLGKTPMFWARYFTSRATTGSGEYHDAIEGHILAKYNIPVVPVARQTNHVSDSKAVGYADGIKNGQDIVASFGEQYLRTEYESGVRIFLDVEGSGASHLTQEYYEGWADGLYDSDEYLEIIPCVYGIPGDAATWTALRQALEAGSTCGGIWLSHPYSSQAEPVQWEEKMLRPFTPIPDVPVWMWQYLFGSVVDRNMINPNIEDPRLFLDSIVVPQS